MGSAQTLWKVRIWKGSKVCTFTLFASRTPTSSSAPWPQWSAEHLVEDSFSYPISFNGKTRLQLEFPIALSKEEVEAAVLANPEVQAKLGGQAPKKVIVVPKRIVNIVV